MFNKKRIMELKRKIGTLEWNVKELQKEVRQLNCSHKETDFIINYEYTNEFYEECWSCNKILRYFDSEIEIKKAKNKKLKEDVEKRTLEIKRLEMIKEKQ